MNGMLTWWAVSLAVLSHPGLGNEIVGRQELIRSVPVFVALLVLLIRVLIIGSFTLGSGRLFAADERRSQLMLRPLAGRSQRPDVRGANVPVGRPVRREPANVPAPAFIHSNEFVIASSSRSLRGTWSPPGLQASPGGLTAPLWLARAVPLLLAAAAFAAAIPIGSTLIQRIELDACVGNRGEPEQPPRSSRPKSSVGRPRSKPGRRATGCPRLWSPR